MGFFSDLFNFHEAGEESNVNTVEKFGQPARSLYTSTKVFTLHHHIDITDDNERLAYSVDSKMISLHDRTSIDDASGRHVADIERKLISIHERHTVTMADGRTFDLSNELLHIIKDITNIEGLGWQLRGDILQLNFELYDSNNKILAVVGQKLISLHDKFCIDIYQPEHEQEIVAIVVALQHMVCDREDSENMDDMDEIDF